MTPDAQRLLELARVRWAALRPTLPTDSHGWLPAQLLLSDAASEMRLEHQRVAGMMRRPDGDVQAWAWTVVGNVLLYLDRDTDQIQAAEAGDRRFEPSHTLTISGFAT